MQFNEDKFTIVNLRDYKKGVPHAVNAEPTYVWVWDDPEDCWDYSQLDVTVDDDEVLIQETNQTAGQGRHIAVKKRIIEQFIDENILESPH